MYLSPSLLPSLSSLSLEIEAIAETRFIYWLVEAVVVLVVEIEKSKWQRWELMMIRWRWKLVSMNAMNKVQRAIKLITEKIIQHQGSISQNVFLSNNFHSQILRQNKVWWWRGNVWPNENCYYYHYRYVIIPTWTRWECRFSTIPRCELISKIFQSAGFHVIDIPFIPLTFFNVPLFV